MDLGIGVNGKMVMYLANLYLIEKTRIFKPKPRNDKSFRRYFKTMTAKKITFNLNDHTKWAEINWLNFEISNSIDAIRKLISMNREMLKTVKSELHKKIKFTEKENEKMDEQILEQYLEHLYGIDERMTSELVSITNVSEISTVLSIFESKLKVICDRIIIDFGGELPLESNSVIHKHWKFLKIFLDEYLGKVESPYTYIKNTYVLRNVLVHQDSVATKEQFNKINGLKNIEFFNFEDKSYYVLKIEDKFIDDLTDRIEMFFIETFKALQLKTNSIV